MSSCDKSLRKTYKREIATVMVAFLGAFFVWGVFRAEAGEAARYLTLPVFAFAGGAFGLDAMAKQLQRPDTRN